MTTKVDRDELLTVRQVLELLGGVSRDTFYEWREKRTAPPCFRLPNGHLRVRRGDLLDWLEALRDQPGRVA
ncbi:helix-turn-helix transcriptional regulator [Pseudonocardia endophytica]|uniref:AlpA family transcriptional regulator n=1 Tax=Pseudonocardia endophytica TaxID=401976 RepID=A0A4R1HT98_PSEEN|nr:helix-turn-helix domain-containing protein [Pseudonocardia endophytica]TCK20632.1 AlpA family transcriptional regulator [Pseudonocardia endophytica]